MRPQALPCGDRASRWTIGRYAIFDRAGLGYLRRRDGGCQRAACCRRPSRCAISWTRACWPTRSGWRSSAWANTIGPTSRCRPRRSCLRPWRPGPRQIHLGSAVTVLSTDDPIRVFERFSTLNAISNGRAEVIVGRGSFTESYPLFGFDLVGLRGAVRGEAEPLRRAAQGTARDLGGTVAPALEGPAHLPAHRKRHAANVGGRRRHAAVGGARRLLRLPADAGDHRRQRQAFCAVRGPVPASQRDGRADARSRSARTPRATWPKPTSRPRRNCGPITRG